jgi:hypothetical protein
MLGHFVDLRIHKHPRGFILRKRYGERAQVGGVYKSLAAIERLMHNPKWYKARNAENQRWLREAAKRAGVL